MSHPIDKLFKDKVEGMEVLLPVNAWEKVQQHRKKKKNFYSAKIWLSAAASLFLLVSTVFIFINDYSVSDRAVTDALVEKATDTPLMKDVPEPLKPAGVTKKEVSPGTMDVQRVSKTEKIKQKTDESSPEIMRKVDESLVEIPDLVMKMTASATIPSPDNPVLLTKVEIPVFTEKTTTEATLLDKIANTAREIKNNEGMMAELRELKDEVISLEFFKTKKSI